MNRTQLVCMHEGTKNRSIDPVFIRVLIKSLSPAWLRPWGGSNTILFKDCGARSQLISRFPTELNFCLKRGGNTTLLVLADLDHDCETGDVLKERFWKVANAQGFTKPQFDQAIFAFAKDRLENWIEFLSVGATDESQEGPRVQSDQQAVLAARKLASMCQSGDQELTLPPSLEWSCINWRTLTKRFRAF